MKLVCDKTSVPLSNPNRKTKLGLEIRLETEVEITTTENAKEGKKHKNMLGWKDKNKIVEKSNNSTWGDESKDIGKRKEI